MGRRQEWILCHHLGDFTLSNSVWIRFIPYMWVAIKDSDDLPWAVTHLIQCSVEMFSYYIYTIEVKWLAQGKTAETVVSVQSVQSLSRVQLFVTPLTAAQQASLSITNSRSLLKLMSIESLMPSNHLILCHPLLPHSTFPSIRVFSNESALRIRWPKYWSFSFNISPSN